MATQQSSNDAQDVYVAVETNPIRLRSYQHEMFERSLTGNTIVVVRVAAEQPDYL